MTNIERIKTMSEDDLVMFLKNPFCNERLPSECSGYCGNCDKCIRDWLAKDDGIENNIAASE